jgi:hypothetical protein
MVLEMRARKGSGRDRMAAACAGDGRWKRKAAEGFAMSSTRNHGLWAAGGAWLVLVIAGFAALVRYASLPGAAAASPAHWPAASALRLARDGSTLVFFAHPRCACTRAGLNELHRLQSRVAHPPLVYVVFQLPAGVSDEWRHGELWASAQRIPGARVIADEEGTESARFRVRTSGTAQLFDRGGRLQFSGGLTESRGHEGDSFGEARLITLLEGGVPDRNDSPVFGCPLDEKEVAP